MNYYFAPMEGITGYLFRNAHAEQFPGVDRYYSPFLSANHNYSFQNKEKRDVAPEHNDSLKLVPQLLTKKADEFVWGAMEMFRLGYGEVNLNLGCPSSTVASKGKGSGFLAHPDELDRFFDRTFEMLGKQGAGPKISVKTRIGYADAKEAVPLMRIFNRYPIAELIIHSRIRTAMYGGVPDLEAFSEMYAMREIPTAFIIPISLLSFSRLVSRIKRIQRMEIVRITTLTRRITRIIIPSERAFIRRISG